MQNSAAEVIDPLILKQIKIKTGVVRRLVKEHSCYMKEVENEIQRIEKLREGATSEDDEYAVKKAGQVLQETRAMIGDTARRCRTAVEDLQKFLANNSLEECQEVKDAHEQIIAASRLPPS